MSLKERYTAPQPPAPRKRLTCNEWLIALGCGGLLILACGSLIVGGIQGLMVVATEEAARGSEKQNCKQIAAALMQYESTYKQFPPAYTVDASGNKLHSWRTLILPFLGEEDLYKKIDLSKAWDASENAAAHAAVVRVYKSSSVELPAGQTLIRAVVDPTGVFTGAESTRISAIRDGTTKTLLFLQVGKDQATHWMAPEDYSLKDFQSITEANAPYRHGTTYIVYADGSVGDIELPTLKPKDLEALVNINDRSAVHRH